MENPNVLLWKCRNERFQLFSFSVFFSLNNSMNLQTSKLFQNRNRNLFSKKKFHMKNLLNSYLDMILFLLVANACLRFSSILDKDIIEKDFFQLFLFPRNLENISRFFCSGKLAFHLCLLHLENNCSFLLFVNTLSPWITHKTPKLHSY